VGLSEEEPQTLQRAAMAQHPGAPLSSAKQEIAQAAMPDDPMIKLSPTQLQKLRTIKMPDDSPMILPPRENKRAHMSDFVDLPTLILSSEAIQNLRNADLTPTRTTLLSPVNILPTRSASRLLSRPLDPLLTQPTTTIILPSTITTPSRPARIWGTLLAVGAGLLEGIALLLFSRTTLVANTGIAAVLASNYSVVTVLVGLIAFRERLALQQYLGILLVFCGICLLALSSV
jgi:multidrug transporter EmrE-like cation transporter